MVVLNCMESNGKNNKYNLRWSLMETVDVSANFAGDPFTFPVDIKESAGCFKIVLIDKIANWHQNK